MAMLKFSCGYLLAVALLGCLTDAQSGKQDPYHPPPLPQAPKTQIPNHPKPQVHQRDHVKQQAPQPNHPKPQAPQPNHPKPQAPQPNHPKPQAPQPNHPKQQVSQRDYANPYVKPQEPAIYQPDTPQGPQYSPPPQQPRPQQPRPQQPRPQEPRPQQPRPQEPRPQEPRPQQPRPQEPRPQQPRPQEPRPQEPRPQQPKPQTPKKTPPYSPEKTPPYSPEKTPSYSPKKPHTESFHTCEVDDHEKIQCGTAGISAQECNQINCCFDGRQCFYGKSVTLQCTKDAQFIVVVARDATLPNIDLESVTFLGHGQECAPVGTTSAFAIYQFPVTSCGTVLTEEPGVVIYENRMSSSFEVAVGPFGMITRDSQYELLVQCRYIGTSVEALVIEVGLVPAPIPVAAPGPLRVELRLGNGLCTVKGCAEEDAAFTSFYLDGDYPVVKVLRDLVYVEVRILERTDPNLVLTLGRCWATSDPFPYSYPQWDLLIDGCPYRDDRYLSSLIPVDASSGLAFPTHHRRFNFKMFTFVGTVTHPNPHDPQKGLASDAGKIGHADPEVMIPLQEKVYIHCETTVCRPYHGDNCEPKCYRKRRDVAAADQKHSRSVTTLVSSQEVVIVNSQ